jgi:4-hydroxy-tetrahydrodipicolinate reductase
MGRALVRLVHEDPALELASAISAEGVGGDAGELAGVGRLGVAVTHDMNGITGADVAIDFSSPAGTTALLDSAVRAGVAVVSGTTGLAGDTIAALDRAATRIPVLWEPNMSIGVHVLGALVRQAAAALGPGFDIEIVEAHHRMKVDAPSGTALRLAEHAEAGRADVTSRAHGREGRPGARPASEIGMHAVRGGDVIGDHSVHFLGIGERLELVHRATSRDVFAHGALRAARWIAGRPAGRYTLADVLR